MFLPIFPLGSFRITARGAASYWFLGVAGYYGRSMKLLDAPLDIRQVVFGYCFTVPIVGLMTLAILYSN